MDFFWLMLLGFGVGIYGTLIGAGGGFILIPVLIFLYPERNTELITSISLAVVFANSFSGSISYARLGRIDYKSGLLFAAATIPGAAAGAYSASFLPRRIFDPLFGSLLIAVALLLMVKPSIKEDSCPLNAPFHLMRNLRERNGLLHAYSYNYLTGVGLSLIIGYASSILGVGGGIIHVPVLIYLLHFPPHIATATSHFILTVTAGTASVVHMATGSFFQGFRETLPLALGVLAGAPLGAKISCRIRESYLMRALALALLFVGLRIVMAAL